MNLNCLLPVVILWDFEQDTYMIVWLPVEHVYYGYYNNGAERN